MNLAAHNTVTKPALKITIYSDYVCPFCYLELPILEQALTQIDADVEVVWQPFELRPYPAATLDPDGEYLHRIWNSVVYPMAEERAMVLKLPPVQPYSSKALQAAEFAKTTQYFDRFHRSMFQAFFEHGQDISQDEVILDVAEKAGINSNELQKALDDKRYLNTINTAHKQAIELGVSSVPSFVLTNKQTGASTLQSGALNTADVIEAATRVLK